MQFLGYMLLLLLTPTVAPAQVDSTKTGRWSLLPIIFSSPDTGFGFGVLPQYIFRTSPATRPSSVRLDLYYTMEEQFNLTGRADTWLSQNKHRLAAKAQFRRWPTSYYGIGNTYDEHFKEGYTERSVELGVELQRRIKPGIYVAGRLGLDRFEVDKVEEGRTLSSGRVSGSGGGETIGIGIAAVLDTRDDTFYPKAGHQIRLEGIFHPRVLGMDFGFTQYRFDARTYVHVNGPQVFAFQGTAASSTGSPPFQKLFGAGEIVRGYSSKRYSDKHLLAFQAEYRVVPLIWRFGLALFVGGGQVAASLDDFAVSRFHMAYGAGIRFQIIRSENINVRWDFGFGGETSADYLDLNEAF